ncbi:MAG TPA: hypothetical protein PK548_04280 [Bacteroidales bacterium]|nr:hypothetical protein [Bacteroidales bacterium]
MSPAAAALAGFPPAPSRSLKLSLESGEWKKNCSWGGVEMNIVIPARHSILICPRRGCTAFSTAYYINIGFIV